jgi:putative peptidoglycan lipid II flippase
VPSGFASTTRGPRRCAVLPGNAVLEVASQLYLLPHSIIALSLATVLFNRMTRASQDGNKAELRDALSHGLRTMAVATVFGALALFALAGPLGMFFSGGAPRTASCWRRRSPSWPSARPS